MGHAWCTNVSRDAAVRAAEDGRQGPLPTLEECIERQKKSQTARPCGGTDPAPLGGEPGGAGNGMRTERVVLEITGAPGWRVNVTGSDVESVRVVEETHFDDLAQVVMQRDAAIRERDELKSRVVEDSGLERIKKRELIRQRDAAIRERDAALARVAELEECISNAFSAGIHESFCKVDESWKAILPRTAAAIDEQLDKLSETFSRACPIAGGTVNVNGQDMVTLSEFLRHTTKLTQEAGVAKRQRDAAIREREELRARAAELEAAAKFAEGANADAGSNQPLGWLTGEEREALRRAASVMAEEYHHGPTDNKAADVINAILARSTPPEVVLPAQPDCSPIADYGRAWRDCLEAVRSSLVAAGVRVKEVGSE